MKTFATPLAERQRIARYYRERYASDQEWRLKKLNRSRQGHGLHPYSSADEIKTRSHGGRSAAATARRDERGRFA